MHFFNENNKLKVSCLVRVKLCKVFSKLCNTIQMKDS